MSAVRLDGVRVSLGGQIVLDGVDLAVGRGQWLGLVGPNAAGKTTLLRAVAGLVPAVGRVRVHDADVRRLSRRAVARLVTLVPQQPLVPPGMRVVDYVLLGRAPWIPYLGVESRRDLDVVDDVLGRLDLRGLVDRPVATLSGGQFQRVLLARALAQQAPVLLLDEPTSALDVGRQQQALELVDRLRREHRLTVLSAMHDLTLAGQFAERLVLIAGGRAVACGRPDEVLTEARIAAHYGAAVRVLPTADGPVVVPARAGVPAPRL